MQLFHGNTNPSPGLRGPTAPMSPTRGRRRPRALEFVGSVLGARERADVSGAAARSVLGCDAEAFVVEGQSTASLGGVQAELRQVVGDGPVAAPGVRRHNGGHRLLGALVPWP